MVKPDITTDYLLLDFLVSVQYYNVTGDKTWNGPNTINNCSLFDALPTYDGDDVYYRRASLNVPMLEWFDPTIPAQRQDYLMLIEDQQANAVRLGTTRKYFVDQSDFDERLQLWRLQLFTEDK